jgi:uncharacterized protein YgiM (DUF1202 family)
VPFFLLRDRETSETPVSTASKELIQPKAVVESALKSKSTAQGASDKMQVTNLIQVTIRAAPGTSAKIIGLLASDDEVTVLEPGEKWTKIRTPAGKEGWVITRFLQ